MKCFLSLLFVFCTSIVTLSASDTIIVGGDYNYPPYSFIDENGIEKGYDVDVIKAVSRITNLNIVFQFDEWDSTLTHLDNGTVDMIASIVYSESREKKYDFTFPLHTEYYAIFSLKGAQILDVHDLKGKRRANLEGDISNESFFKPMGLLSNKVEVSSLPEAFTLINEGKCDYVVAPYPLGMATINESEWDNIEVKGPPIIPSVYCLAVRQGNAKLLAQLNNGIQELSRTGELQQIYDKWVKHKRKEDKYETFFSYALISIMGLAVILLVLFLFLYSLRKQVSKKTKQIKNAETVYLNIFNTVGDAIIILDSKGIVVDVNKKTTMLYEMSREEMVGSVGRKLINLENHTIFDECLQSLKTNQTYYKETVCKTNAEKKYFLEVKASVVKLKNEQRNLVVLRDKTEETLSRQNLEEAKKDAEEANNTKSRFLATISHEIRTPLNAMIGFSNLLADSGLNKKQTDYNNKINMSSDILLAMVNDLLDITKIEANKIKLNKAPFSFRQTINKIISIVETEAKQKGLSLNYDINEHIPDYVIGDELRVSQILMNLLNNAVKFTEKGNIVLIIKFDNKENLHSNKNKTRLLFTVQDSGIGIPKEKQHKLFSPFEQLQNANNRKYVGTGLGLSISKELVERMGGAIMVESTPNKGSIFRFSIELELIEKGEKKDYIQDTNQSNSNTLNQKLYILLVEDNAFNAEILIEQIKKAGHTITHAQSGEQAIKQVKSNIFDIMLMDIEMPEMDGFETASIINQHTRNKLPIIALSAHALESEKEKAISAGFCEYLNKPVSTEVLFDTIFKFVPILEHNSQTINYKEAINEFGYSEEMYQKILKRFVQIYKDMPSQFSNYTIDSNDLKDVVHNLKSGSKSIGALQLSATATETENYLKQENFAQAQNHIKTLSSQLQEVIDEITKSAVE